MAKNGDLLEDSLKFRVVIMGQGRVGKTALLKRFLDNEFLDRYKETVEDLHRHTFDVNGILIKVDFLDTAGNLSFPAMRRLNMSTAKAFVLVYSVENRSSFDEVTQIFQEMLEIRGASECQTLPVVVVCNKCDLPSNDRVSKREVEEFIMNKTFDFNVAHVEASAKTGDNVRKVFEELVSLSEVLKRDSELTQTPTRKPKPQRRFSLQTHQTVGNFSPTTLARATERNEQSVPIRRPTIASGDVGERLKMQMQALRLHKSPRKCPPTPTKQKSLSRQSSKTKSFRKQSSCGDDVCPTECHVQ